MSTATGRLDKLEKLLKLDPNDAFVLYGLAQEHAKAGPEGQLRALDYYDRCIAADPTYCYAYYHKAVCLQSLNRRAEAKSTIQSGLEASQKANDLKAVSELTNLLATL